jgi:hypothetical protein
VWTKYILKLAIKFESPLCIMLYVYLIEGLNKGMEWIKQKLVLEGTPATQGTYSFPFLVHLNLSYHMSPMQIFCFKIQVVRHFQINSKIAVAIYVLYTLHNFTCYIWSEQHHYRLMWVQAHKFALCFYIFHLCNKHFITWKYLNFWMSFLFFKCRLHKKDITITL